MGPFGGDCRGSFVALGLRTRLVHFFLGKLRCSSHVDISVQLINATVQMVGYDSDGPSSKHT